jgi:hypothetical protein
VGTKLDVATTAVTQILNKQAKLLAADLDILRKNTLGAQSLSSKSDYFMFRTEIELIDAIRSLDETSAKLVTKTNWLTGVILAFTIALFFIGMVVIMVRHP